MRGRGRKSGGLTGNLVKLGGSKRKLKLLTDMRGETAVNSSFKKAHKQAHKRA